MYSPANSAGQSRESVNSSSDSNSTSLNSRLIPRGTDIGDEELVFRNDSSKSKLTKNHSYMASLSTSQKVRNAMPASPTASTSGTTATSPSRISTSANNSATNLQHPGHRSTTSTGNSPQPNGGSNPRSSTTRLPLRASSGAVSRMAPGALPPSGGGGSGGHQRKPSIDARGFLRALNDLFFGKFCVDELFYREFREQLVKRIQDSTYRYEPEDLQEILEDVSEACKSTRLNLDAVSQWKLNYFTRDQTASVIDHIFLTNVNLVMFDPKFSNQCLDAFCPDPLCSEIHAGRVTEEDKAKAFRRVLNVVLNEALRIRLINKEQKVDVRMRLVKSVFAADDRVNTVRELAVLIMMAQDERHRDVVAHAVAELGQVWTQADSSSQLADGGDEDCNLDPDMVYRKAMSAINNLYLESILDVRRLGMNISAEEVGRLSGLWAQSSARVPDNKVITLPMLLHLLVHCSESELRGALPQTGVSVAALAKAEGGEGNSNNRIEQVEDAALQIVQNLGLAWELGDNPPRDLRQFCMVLLLDLGSVLSKFVVLETSTVESSSSSSSVYDSDAREIGIVEDGLFAKWWEVCDAVIRFERAHRRFHTAFLMTYIKTSSEKLLGQKADFNPELFLSMVIELLTEYRKRRPDYDAIVLTADGRLAASVMQNITDSNSSKSSGSSESVGQQQRKSGQQPQQQALDRSTREDIGSEFDRLFAWVDQQLPVTNRIRALVRASSPKSRQPSWQMSGSMDKMRSPSAASIGYGSASVGANRVASTLPPMPGGGGGSNSNNKK